MSFLKGFVQAMKPIAAAMEFLQSEKEWFVEHVVSTIMGIKRKLRGLGINESTMPLRQSILTGLLTRLPVMGRLCLLYTSDAADE